MGSGQEVDGLVETKVGFSEVLSEELDVLEQSTAEEATKLESAEEVFLVWVDERMCLRS